MVVAVAVVVANVVADVVAAAVDFLSPICFREMLRVSRKTPLFIAPYIFFQKKNLQHRVGVGVGVGTRQKTARFRRR